MPSGQRRLDDEQELEVVAAYGSAAPAPELARRYGCSSTVIYKILKKHGVTRKRGGPSRLGPQQERDMIAAYLAGESKRSILQRFDISESGFLKVRRRHAIPAREYTSTSSLFTAAQEQAIVDEYQQGSSLSELGRLYGCCLETIRKVLKRHDVARRPRGNTLRQFSEAEIAEFSARWASGESQHSIGKSIGLSQTQVSALLRDIDAPPEVRVARGAGHGQWRGGRVAVGNGYVGVRLDATDSLRAMAHAQGYVLEHRLVVARSLGRPLLRSETVHHINGVRDDNRLENLQLRNGNHGNGKASRCGDCGSHNIIDAPLAEVPPLD